MTTKPEPTEQEIEEAMDLIEDDICPIEKAPLEIEITYDDLGWHACKYCADGHVWRLDRADLGGPDPEAVADGLVDYA